MAVKFSTVLEAELYPVTSVMLDNVKLDNIFCEKS